MTEQDNISSKKIKEQAGLNYGLAGGRLLASPLPGEEIVISGMSGAFPHSNNIQEFRDNLFNKVNMVRPNIRWEFNHPEIPMCSGTIPVIDKYDAGFFGVHGRQSNSLDTMNRMFLEKSIEAIFDAGLHPADLENTKTGVFVGTCFSESDKSWHFDNLASQSYALTGAERSMLAHRLSYFLKLKGPSFTTDTACSSSLYAFEHAFRALRLGEIDNAIIGGTNLCLHPFVSLQFARLGVLSKDGSCKAFDKSGNGYARSETIAAVLLQKAKNAKRIYAQVVYAKTNCDGYKEQGITYPSGPTQKDLLTDFYEECNIDRYSLSYLEAHGTGTFVGDPEECTAIDETLTKNRKSPLLIGSVKSNIGHSEPGSGLCSIVKCLIGLETGFIPPNLHYTTPRDEIKGLCEGRMKVVSEKIPFEDNRGLVGINSFGFGGGNCHILLRRNMKEKVKDGLPKDDLPRLVCISGRTEAAITSIVDEICNNKLDAEYIKLLHDIFRKDIQNHIYRGYTIASKNGEVMRSVNFFSGNCRPLYFAFGELNDWSDIGSHLMTLPIFANSIQRFQKSLDKGIDITNMLLNKSSDGHVNHIIGSVAVQIGIVDILNSLEMRPKYSFGCSFGVLASSYYNGMLTLEETINCALVINEYVNKANKFLSFNYNDYQQKNLENGNHPINGDGRFSGTRVLSDIVRQTLKSGELAITKENLVQNLTNIFEGSNGTPSKNISVNCFINSLSNNIFQDSVSNNPNSVILQIGVGKVRNDLENVSVISLSKSVDDYLMEFLKCLGSLYEYGYNPQIEKLYPSIDLPVSRGTPMVSPFIRWKHEKEWFVPEYNLEVQNQAQHGARPVKIQITDHQWTYLGGHVIDGRNLFPATGYLFLVWETLAIITSVPLSIMKVEFENCKFVRATAIPNKGFLQLSINIQKETGNFEVIEGESAVVTGRIRILDNDSRDKLSYGPTDSSKSVHLSLKTKDIYKELRLRGYNYSGGFRAIQECDNNASTGYIKWEDNWVTFIDNMLQMKILQMDSRLLYVPTYISKLTINAKTHLAWVNSYLEAGSVLNLPVTNDEATGTVRCGDILLSGLIASSISRKKNLGIPVLESYKFVPNFTDMNTHESVRVNMQIILENALVYKFKVVELVDDFTSEDAVHLAPIVQTVLQDQPLIRPFIKILSKIPLDVPVEVENKKLTSETDCLLVIASNILERPEFLQETFASITENGFIISRESHDYNLSNITNLDVTIITVHKTQPETLVLLQKRSKIKQLNCIKVRSSGDFSWLAKAQEAITKIGAEDLLLYSEKEINSGVMGLVNCLRREPDCANVKCLFVMDKTENFDPKVSIYADQLKKNLAVNVYKNGQWGTYRHLLLEESNAVECEHCYANVIVRGDLSSLRWIEGPLSHNMTVPSENELVHIYYAALNFRDVMTALGKINADVITQDRREQECVQGFEFSGRDKRGNRVMGMVTKGALSTLILADPYLTFKVPDFWTLEEAATVPVVYGTVIYALNIRTTMRKGETILIHSGTGGIGQAAIRLALHNGCRVYTTVGNQEKRDFLKRTFPQLKDHHIGNSHDESFEEMIYRETSDRGVDIVLNSLAEEKLITSVRCLAKGGRFIEIGKFDMANNNQLSLLLFQKEASFHGIMLDQLFTEGPDVKRLITKILQDGINYGIIKPLSKTIFKFHEVEQAFRFMATGKHKGKVLVEIRKPERELLSPPSIQKFPSIARYSCSPENTYIIVGGLGGFGLELADWLVLRGAKKLVLTSRKGISTGYQSSRIRIWQSYGSIIKISLADVTTEVGCKELIEESLKLGPIGAIFNLAVVLADSIFANQSAETFNTSFGPKARATEYLDKLSRKMCPDLSEFVVFSSVSCGRGNAGQTNYGMANSVMERICEQRRSDGYPALAIEWGAIGEVGLVAEMQEEHTELEIGGTLQQRISSCLKVLDGFLRQTQSAIVSSMVVAEKRGGIHAADNIVDVVINILGLDAKSVSSYLTLAELGMDSMTAVEIKTTLEREFEVFLSAKDIRTLTLSRLKQIQEEKDGISTNEEDKNLAHFGLEMFFRVIGQKSDSCIPYIRLESNVHGETAPNVLLFPGIEGFAKVYEPLAAHLNANMVCLQFRYDTQEETILDMANSIVPIVEELSKKTDPFIILAYSYGALVALEVVHILESRGYTGTIICIDGAPILLKELLKNLDMESSHSFETSLLCHLLSFYTSFEVILKHKESLFKCKSWEERVDVTIDIAKEFSTEDSNYQRTIANGIYRRVKALATYNPSYSKIKSNIKLFKPNQVSMQGLAHDYNLSTLFLKPVEVQVFEGNHVSILENKLLAEAINTHIKEYIQTQK